MMPVRFPSESNDGVCVVMSLRACLYVCHSVGIVTSLFAIQSLCWRSWLRCFLSWRSGSAALSSAILISTASNDGLTLSSLQMILL